MIEIESMAVAMPEVKGHPNRAAFRGVLTVVDAASQRPPSGARGHLVVLTKRAAEAALPSLLGMGLDYAPSLDRHDVRRKVGVITRAEVVGRNLELGGYLFARDFPEIVKEIAKSGHAGNSFSAFSRHGLTSGALNIAAGKSLTHGGSMDVRDWKSSLSAAVGRRILSLRTSIGETPRDDGRGTEGLHATLRVEASSAGAGLGMSYEVTDVELADARARIWMLTKVTFTGAAILRRDKAAYRNTWIELGT